VKRAYGIRSRGPSDLRYAEVTVCVDRHATWSPRTAIADQWRSGSSATCGYTKSPCTWNHAEPLGEQRSRTARRPPRSLKQEYQEFLLQRIEDYKNALTREDLLEIGDEAVRELEGSAAGSTSSQKCCYSSTSTASSPGGCAFLHSPAAPEARALRAAQRAPTHWGLESDGPLVSAVRRLEPGDLAVVVGAAALPAALFIAAHDAEVFLVDHDLGAVEGAESRAVTEQLAGRFQALVVTFGSWFPDVAPSLVIIDPAALAVARARDRMRCSPSCSFAPGPAGCT